MRWFALLTVLGVLGCGPRQGFARITITFENETRTRCVRVSARPTGSTITVNATPSSIERTGDELVVGLAETEELTGMLEITVFRFEQAGCMGRSFASETKPVTVTRGTESFVEFIFRGEQPDGGVDGGVDAGCDLETCPAPGPCEEAAIACDAPGSCTYSSKTTGTLCPGGVCSSGQCIANSCSVVPEGTVCDDGLPCTSFSSCFNGACRPMGCSVPAPACQRIRSPIEQCDPIDNTRCVYEPDPTQDDVACDNGQGQCLAGTCRPWLPSDLVPRFFESRISQVPYPTEAWILVSNDGGPCDVVLSTAGAVPSVEDGGCGLPATVTASLSRDGGTGVFTMTGLTVGPNVTVHLTGPRPAQLLVLGDAVIDGLISVAPQVLGVRPAGAHPPSCLDAGVGTMNQQGGGGGGFGAVGGQGGNSGGAGGGATPSDQAFRGGCGGGRGGPTNAAADGGVGGGAVNLIVAGTLTIRNGGAVTASGGGGQPGTADQRGGGGGGSGGMVVLEATRIVLVDGGAVTANGGGGGEGGKNGQTSAPGPFGSFTTAMQVPTPDNSIGGGNGGVGGAGSISEGGQGLNGTGGGNPGGGGGGGGIGVLLLRSRQPCVVDGGVLSGFRTGDTNCQ
jgi:hypothetical protein